MGIPRTLPVRRSGYFSAVGGADGACLSRSVGQPAVQDIPLAAVLRSAIGGSADEAELAWSRSEARQRERFYELLQSRTVTSGEDAGLAAEKLATFLSACWSASGHEGGVHAGAPAFVGDSGCHRLRCVCGCASCRAGSGKANLDMLVEKAIAYEATSYRGLYHFVRYIESLKRYEVDYGEASHWDRIR